MSASNINHFHCLENTTNVVKIIFFKKKSLVLLSHPGCSSCLFSFLEKAGFTKEFEPFYSMKTESGLGKTTDEVVVPVSSNS